MSDADRYLEQVNSGMLLPGAEGNGKYDASRQLAAGAAPMPGAAELKQTRLLDAA